MTDLREIAAWLRVNSDDLKSDWRSHCEVALLCVWPEFHETHPYLVPEPEPWDAIPPLGAAYPSLLRSYLQAVTGVEGWGVRLDENKVGHFLVTIPVMP